MDRITDRPDMTSAVYRGRKASTQTNKQKNIFFAIFENNFFFHKQVLLKKVYFSRIVSIKNSYLRTKPAKFGSVNSEHFF